MHQTRIPAVFMRGGTSNAVVFHERDLPADRSAWDAIFLAALGSPDPNGRQLDGMGGGISSLSKACVVGPPSRADADVDFTFAQVSVREARVDYRGNCGNMTSAIGPFAVDEGLVAAAGEEARLVIHNTNTGKLVRAVFPLDAGRAAVEGDLVIPGIAGSGAPVRLEFLDPGGAGTGALLPTGNAADVLDVPGLGAIEASLVDAANPCVFVEAAALGLTGTEMPAELDARTPLMEMLEHIRCAAGVAMGLDDAPERIGALSPGIPKIGFVAPPARGADLAGAIMDAEQGDITARMISMGNTHRALPLTGALCLAVSARVAGTIPHRCARPAGEPGADLRVMQPSGLTLVAAEVAGNDGAWRALQATVYRTQRRLFEGNVLVPAARLADARSARAAS